MISEKQGWQDKKITNLLETQSYESGLKLRYFKMYFCRFCVITNNIAQFVYIKVKTKGT